jgi:hypothetical protein
MIISECFVWKWLMGESEPVVAGRLVQNMDGQQIFTYGRSYIERHNAESIYSDELPLINGVQTSFVGLSDVLSTCESYGLTEQKAKAEIERIAQVVVCAYQNLAVQCSLEVATRNMLWRGAILKRNIFYGGFEYLNEKVENF